jgi:hypothetical protein
MSKPETSIYGLRPHHIAMAIIAVIVAVALLANFYLW